MQDWHNGIIIDTSVKCFAPLPYQQNANPRKDDFNENSGLELDEQIEVEDFMKVVRSAFKPGQVKSSFEPASPYRPFAKLPDVVLNPIHVQEFRHFTRDELHER